MSRGLKNPKLRRVLIVSVPLFREARIPFESARRITRAEGRTGSASARADPRPPLQAFLDVWEKNVPISGFSCLPPQSGHLYSPRSR